MLRVIKNFYNDPDAIVEMARTEKYELICSGNYIGRDTLNKMIMTPELEQKIRAIFPDEKYKIIRSRFRVALEGDTHMTFVHSDCVGLNQGWHILIYLSKMEDDGLVFYQHVDKGPFCNEGGDYIRKDTENFDKFKPWKIQPYEFNTALVIDYGYFHSPKHKTGNGSDFDTSRLLHIIEVVDSNSNHYKKCIAL